MIHDIFVPCRVGNYYLHTKRLLSIEVSSVCVSGIIFEYSGNSRSIKQNFSIFLKDFGQQGQINAIKKIVGLAGRIDEIVTTLSSSAIIFKELELPFIGFEALKMVIPFEIENVLPFALQEAVIDFLIVRENLEKNISTVLVAAIRKEDINAQHDLFIKADVSLDLLLIDVFALYYLYKTIFIKVDNTQRMLTTSKSNLKVKAWSVLSKLYALASLNKKEQDKNEKIHSLQNFQPKTSDIMIDIGFDSIKVLYIKNGFLDVVRIVPFGVSDCFDRVSKQLALSYHDVAHDLMTLSQSFETSSVLNKEFKTILDEIERTISYFKQQSGEFFLTPNSIILSGYLINHPVFLEQAKQRLGLNVVTIDSHHALKVLRTTMVDSSSAIVDFIKLLAVCVITDTKGDEHNLLQDIVYHSKNKILYVQLLAMLFVSILCVGGIWFRSMQDLQKWQTSYNVSKRQLIQTVEQQMKIDLKGEKALKKIVEDAQDVLKRERQLWFSFTRQNETSILEYLQDISVAIDRHAIGLDLKQMHLDSEKVTMSGSVKNFEALDVFQEELQELKLLKIVDRPRELTWTVQLQSIATQKGAL